MEEIVPAFDSIALQVAGAIQLAEKTLGTPKLDSSVRHHFGPGVYIREITMPAGAIVVGHKHKYHHISILLKGKLKLLCDSGKMMELTAPVTLNTGPGRKILYIIEESVFQNIYAIDERDPVKIEEILIDKSDIPENFFSEREREEIESRAEDRSHFENYILTLATNEEIENIFCGEESDRVDFPDIGTRTVVVRKSPIHGKGIFSSYPIEAYQIIGPAVVNGKKTPFSVYVNHSKSPNCFFVKDETGNVFLMSNKQVKGSVSCDDGEELTVDYVQVIQSHKKILKEEI